MGDRGNIIIREDDSEVVLYSHSGGYGLPQILQKALSLNWRWDDGQYLARIIFCEMVQSGSREFVEEAGFGISSVIGDNEHPLLVVNVDTGRVIIENEDNQFRTPCIGKTWTFQEYIDLDLNDGWNALNRF